MAVRYEPEPDPFLTEQMTGGALRAIVAEIADRISITAQALAPVDTGDYRDSIGYELHNEDIGGGPRVVATVHAGTGQVGSNGFNQAVWVEAKYAVMMKAMGAA